MKIPLFISFFAISTLSATHTTARADSALAVAPLSRNYTIQEIGVVERNEYGFKPEIIGFDEAGKFISNTVSDDIPTFYSPSFPFSSPYLFSPVLPKQPNKSYRVSARNSADMVVGTLGSRAFSWQEGNLQTLPFLSDRAAFVATAADVNDKGQIVGYSLISAPRYGPYKRATLWVNGRAFELEVSPGFWQSQALALSNDGQIAGFIERRIGGEKPLSRAVAWKQKRVQLLEGESKSAATHINERGQIAGWCEAPNVDYATHKTHAVIWQNGKKFDLGEIAEFKGVEFANPIMPFTEAPKPQKQVGGYKTTPTGINNLGQIVGKMDIQDGCSSSSGSFFFDGEMHDLKILFPKGENWEYPSASGINDRGQIIGTARHDGKQCVFLLSPNPQK